jgi:hypothetical protein
MEEMLSWYEAIKADAAELYEREPDIANAVSNSFELGSTLSGFKDQFRKNGIDLNDQTVAAFTFGVAWLLREQKQGAPTGLLRLIPLALIHEYEAAKK